MAEQENIKRFKVKIIITPVDRDDDLSDAVIEYEADYALPLSHPYYLLAADSYRAAKTHTLIRPAIDTW